MQISSRFTLAFHIFACIDTFQGSYKITSDFLAGSTNVNPVIIIFPAVILHTVGPVITGPLTEKDCEDLRICYSSCIKKVVFNVFQDLDREIYRRLLGAS